MRNKFGEWIVSSIEKDNNIILLSGDIGFGIFDKLIERYPANFLNCGIAEQNMIGVASGLAAQGIKPIVYTIIPFLIFRPFEFIRNLIAYQNLNVALVGVGGGFSYDNLGFTHYGIEDINLIKSLPNFLILTPYDPESSLICYDYINKHFGPKYIRLMKGGEKTIKPIKIYNKIHILADFGNDFTFLTHGSLVEECISAAEILNTQGIKGKVVTSIDVKNSNFENFLFGNIYSFEETIFPGLFNHLNIFKLKSNFVDNSYDYKFGNRLDYLKINNLDCFSIIEKVEKDFL
jgi:transketolase